MEVSKGKYYIIGSKTNYNYIILVKTVSSDKEAVICLDQTGLDLDLNLVYSSFIAIWLQERYIIHILFIVSLGILWCCNRKLCKLLNLAQIVYITFYILLLKGLNYLKYVFIIALIFIIAPTFTASMFYYCQNLFIILFYILFFYLGSGGGSYIYSLVLFNVLFKLFWCRVIQK